ncbi:PREDICTED: protoporphyrinogen oxidase-like [Amphimedon queenslandica]|uniref:Protoporphyrinogen oxidase n=2 Tax=Amphimedon queenslandica TaxID=400682 RepID=A0AAN0IQ06_AMPQE|nr:PREDICTED: protoporphyrinogen oxidase-like [Amphimedon queenslandica]|eukprot:XP_011405872.1 PREDICTED: protoporphyrinogen oxidase-like [Amphimedon queenslandica]
MKQRVVILGGGISGLTSAWSLARSSSKHEIILLESSERLGGWINSERMANNGAVHELGPRSMRVAGSAGKTALAMMSELGLESKVIPIKRGHKAAQRRLIYTNRHKLVELPSNVSWLFKTKPPFTKPLLAAVAKEPFIKAEPEGRDESVHQFISRRFGAEVAHWLINPMCRGIFAGDSKRLSLKSCFPLLHGYEQKHGSIIKGMLRGSDEKCDADSNELVIKSKEEKWMIYTLENGLQTLTDTLKTEAERLGVLIRTNTPATSISFGANNKAIIKTNGQEYNADHVIATISAQQLAKILPTNQSKLCSSLSSIPLVDVAVVNVEFEGGAVPKQWREAFGYLVPSHQKSDILGTVFDSATFPELNRKEAIPTTRLTVMMGGEWFQELFGDPETIRSSTLSDIALKSLHTQLGISSDPLDCIATIQKSCIPQYTVGHSQRLDVINDCIKDLPISLLGASYNGVSVNDCIANSLLEVKKILN